MKHSRSLLKLISLARIASEHVAFLSKEERKEALWSSWNVDYVKGYCGIGSRYLELLANDHKIYPIFCAGEFKKYSRILGEYNGGVGHAWLKYQGFIIDTTARQFKNSVSRIERDFDKSVYICRTTNPHFNERCVGPLAKEIVGTWYYEPLDEICEKAKQLAIKSSLKLSPFQKRCKPRINI